MWQIAARPFASPTACRRTATRVIWKIVVPTRRATPIRSPVVFWKRLRPCPFRSKEPAPVNDQTFPHDAAPQKGGVVLFKVVPTPRRHAGVPSRAFINSSHHFFGNRPGPFPEFLRRPSHHSTADDETAASSHPHNSPTTRTIPAAQQRLQPRPPHPDRLRPRTFRFAIVMLNNLHAICVKSNCSCKSDKIPTVASNTGCAQIF